MCENIQKINKFKGKTQSAFFYLKSSISKLIHHKTMACQTSQAVIPLMEIFEGSEQLWWLGSQRPGNRVWSRPHPKTHAKILISVPDVEPKRKARHQIRFKGGALIDQFENWKQLPGSGKRLIICDAKQLKTQRLSAHRTNMAEEVLTLPYVMTARFRLVLSSF